MRAIPYIAAFLTGLFLRTLVAALNGCNYTLDGHDVLCALACIALVYGITRVVQPKKKNRR